MNLKKHQRLAMCLFTGIPLCIIEWRLAHKWPKDRLWEKTHDLPDQH